MAAAKTATPEELVEIRLMKDDGRYKDDVHVVLNGKAYTVQRGKRVMVPKAVAEILDNAQRQQDAAMELSDQLAGEFDAQTQRLGLS